MKKISVAFLLCALLSSCYSYKPLVNLSENDKIDLTSIIRVGKHYRFYLKNGKRMEMKVTSIDNSKVSGFFYNANEIKVGTYLTMDSVDMAKIRKTSAGKTIGAALLPPGLILLIVALTFHPLAGGFGGHP